MVTPITLTKMIRHTSAESGCEDGWVRHGEHLAGGAQKMLETMLLFIPTVEA